MNRDTFSGKLVRLVLAEREKHSEILAAWTHDSEYNRLEDAGPAMVLSTGQIKGYFDQDEDRYLFMIETLLEGKVIGLIGLEALNWPSGDSFVGIGLGERDYWGKGYGTEAMNILLGYAFQEMGLKRVSLTVFEYNPRAIRSYEKVGFQHEGRLRKALNRDGRRWDILFMGILRQEWEKRKEEERSGE